MTDPPELLHHEFVEFQFFFPKQALVIPLQIVATVFLIAVNQHLGTKQPPTSYKHNHGHNIIHFDILHLHIHHSPHTNMPRALLPLRPCRVPRAPRRDNSRNHAHGDRVLHSQHGISRTTSRGEDCYCGWRRVDPLISSEKGIGRNVLGLDWCSR
ncbi:uncharacterized protein LY89DRAFT_147116 [Mollisia scopiformis]|uniref:Uncharacterized protein n=1 Tax=Mollisia scopiformis TaxID=149040 RepID=A0A194X0R2_MOLSC|nr:uncharacterized protein LY89DRAFT_147116 [Mollisia scopiformis]KUJ13775.1 hypothetical protein LY89DRAFT_147116 [Mollisia scopiformis]